MSLPIIYLCAPASPGEAVFEALKIDGPQALIERVQSAVGASYRVRGRPSIIGANLNAEKGGRTDDAARIRELRQILADDEIAAVVAIRGGGWMTRILPGLDFRSLDRRARRLAVFGFSEITPLVNLIGAHRKGYGFYYMTPGFPRLGMERYARLNMRRIAPGRRLSGRAAERVAERWAQQRFPARFDAYFAEIVSILEGRGPERRLTGRLVSGRLPSVSRTTIVGGCLSLVTAMTASPFASRFDLRNKWLVLEDLEETPHRIDRQFAHIKLAGWFDRCAGVLIGDFHLGDQDQIDEVLGILEHHLPRRRNVPVIHSRYVGHTWPQSPLPLGRPVTLRRAKCTRGPDVVHLDVPWSRFRII